MQPHESATCPHNPDVSISSRINLLAGQVHCLSATTPLKLARRPGAAPGKRSFGDSAAQAGARRMKLVRLPGVAPGHAPWREAILLLNHNRGN